MPKNPKLENHSLWSKASSCDHRGPCAVHPCPAQARHAHPCSATAPPNHRTRSRGSTTLIFPVRTPRLREARGCPPWKGAKLDPEGTVTSDWTVTSGRRQGDPQVLCGLRPHMAPLCPPAPHPSGNSTEWGASRPMRHTRKAGGHPPTLRLPAKPKEATLVDSGHRAVS